MSVYLAHVLGILILTAVDIKALLLYMFSQGMGFLCNILYHSEEGRSSWSCKVIDVCEC